MRFFKSRLIYNLERWFQALFFSIIFQLRHICVKRLKPTPEKRSHNGCKGSAAETKAYKPAVIGDLSLPKEWWIFAPLCKENPVLSRNQLKAIPDAIEIAGRRIMGQLVAVPHGKFDFTSVLGETEAGRTAYAFLRLNAHEDMEATLGFGADCWLQTWVDGTLICDTTESGNGHSPPTMHEYPVTVKLTKGS
jgi:hypothetical protein